GGELGPRTHPLLPGRYIGAGAILERRTIHLVGEPEEIEAEYPDTAASWRRNGARSGLGAPLLREGTPIGVLLAWRGQPQPFTDKQMALREPFADQGVIATENTGLYAELQESTAPLREALEQQTAPAEVLRIISHAPPALDPVLRGVVDSAARLCGAS